MATPASLRLPLRILTRSVTPKPTTCLLSIQCSLVTPALILARRWASDLATPRPAAIAASTQLSQTAIESEISQPEPRLPRAVQAVYLKPLRRQAEYGVPSCDLQLRSYSVRNLEFFCDFALRAAYFSGLPAAGPIPLPRIVERWTVPRSSFVFKKSQENFERRTVRRLIQIRDGHPATVEIWLGFLRKHAYYGIGMKANVFEFSKLGIGKEMDINMENTRGEMEKILGQFAFKKGSATAEKAIEMINREDFRVASGSNAPMVKPPLNAPYSTR